MTEDRFKGDWHLALALLFGATAAYNLMRLAATHAPRHAVNVALYTTLTAWEWYHVRQHWRAGSAP